MIHMYNRGMKLFNEIESEVSGTIVKVLADI